MTTYTILCDEFGRMKPLSEIMLGYAEMPAPAAPATRRGQRRSGIRMQIEAMKIGDEREIAAKDANQVSAIAKHVRKEYPGRIFRIETAPTCVRVRRVA